MSRLLCGVGIAMAAVLPVGCSGMLDLPLWRLEGDSPPDGGTDGDTDTDIDTDTDTDSDTDTGSETIEPLCATEPANDKCRDAIDVPPDGGTFTGCLSGAADDATADVCGATLGPDVFYRLVPDAPMDVHLIVTSDDFEPHVWVKTLCSQHVTIACPNDPPQTADIRSANTGSEYTIVVDSEDGTPGGQFEIEIEIHRD